MSTWLHFGSQNPSKSRHGGLLGRLGRVLGRLGRILERLGGLLGRLGRVLERLGLILERLGGVLERLGRVLGRLGAENRVLRRLPSQARSGSVGARSSAWPRLPPNNQDEERLPAERLPTEKQQTSADHLTTDADTPWAPSGPVRIQSAAELRSRHRAYLLNCLIC